LVDDMMSSGGGSPAAKLPPPPAPKPPEPIPAPVPEKPVEPVNVPEPVKEPVRREPIKEVKIPVKDPEAIQKAPPPKPVKHLVEINKNLTRRSADPALNKQVTSDAEANAAREKARQEANERRIALNSALRSLKTGLSSSTTVEMPGPGGEAYANYGLAVKSVYEAAWSAANLTDDDGTAKASVTIQRDGTVLSAHITRPSGSSALDKSVESTLLRVKFIAPFPEGAKETERTFIINFNLKAKRSIG
jgi:TonB family protein